MARLPEIFISLLLTLRSPLVLMLPGVLPTMKLPLASEDAGDHYREAIYHLSVLKTPGESKRNLFFYVI